LLADEILREHTLTTATTAAADKSPQTASKGSSKAGSKYAAERDAARSAGRSSGGSPVLSSADIINAENAANAARRELWETQDAQGSQGSQGLQELQGTQGATSKDGNASGGKGDSSHSGAIGSMSGSTSGSMSADAQRQGADGDGSAGALPLLGKRSASGRLEMTLEDARREARRRISSINRTANRIRLYADDEHFLEEELSATEQMDSRERREIKVRKEIEPVTLAPIFTLKTMRPLREEWQRARALNEANSKRHRNNPSEQRRDTLREELLEQAVMRLAELERKALHSLAARTASTQVSTQAAAQMSTTTVERAAERFLRDYDLLASGITLVCAVSGGADSMAMLDLVFVLSVRFGLRVVVAHCNHQLRGEESLADAEFVRSAAKHYGFGFYLAEVDVAAYAEHNRLSIETAARMLRYQFFEFVAYETSADAVLTAHTQNDVAETMLMNLLRGSGLTGLSGIPPARPLGAPRAVALLARPLLAASKESLEQYCRECEIVWREDSTNALPIYARNRIRHEVMPVLEGIAPALLDTLQRTSGILREADKLVSDIVAKAMPALVEDAETYYPTHLALNVAPLRIQTRFVQSEIIHRAIADKFTSQFGQSFVSHAAVERVLSLVDAPMNTRADINKFIYAVRDRETIVIAPKAAVHTMDERIERGKDYDFGGWRISMRTQNPASIKFTGDTAVEFIDADLVPTRLTLRTWRAGDKFAPIGMHGSTVNVSDYLTNSKISFIQRQNLLVLAFGDNAEDIVWVCGMRLSERFKVTANTKTALRLEFRPKKQPPPMSAAKAEQARDTRDTRSMHEAQNDFRRSERGERGSERSGDRRGNQRDDRREERRDDRQGDRRDDRQSDRRDDRQSDRRDDRQSDRRGQRQEPRQENARSPRATAKPSAKSSAKPATKPSSKAPMKATAKPAVEPVTEPNAKPSASKRSPRKAAPKAQKASKAPQNPA
jgi:tRNA(Ile)-lysidine synthase